MRSMATASSTGVSDGREGGDRADGLQFPNAIKNGVTQEELVEMFTHLAFAASLGRTFHRSSSTALPATLRARSASMASQARSQLPRQPTLALRRLFATRDIR